MYSPSRVLSVASQLLGGIGCARGHLGSRGKGSCSQPQPVEGRSPSGWLSPGSWRGSQLAPGLRTALGGTSVLPLRHVEGPVPAETPSSMLS